MTEISTLVGWSTVTVQETPTMALRFMNGRLQQQWHLVEYKGGFAVERREEWRDVPTVTEGTE